MTTQRSLIPFVTGIPLSIIAIFVLASRWIVPNATQQNIMTGVTAPGTAGHLFGTDQLGRDIGQLAIAGASSAVVGPIVIALGSMVIGILLGTFAGYMGGWLDLLLSKYADLLLALPTTLVALVVTGLIDGGYWVTVLVLIMLFSPTDIRMIRGSVIAQTGRPYIESAKVLGLSRRRIMFRHILPNVLPVAFSTMLLNVAFALVSMSALSFLGLGVGPGVPDWGRQLSDSRDLIDRNWGSVVLPAMLIIITAAAINLLGDWLQDRFERRAVQR
jgi:peptide/nickel transport system permease protein